MERVKLFFKGVCMGVADIIPGVSGGTLALILGIYTELVNTLKGLHLRWLPALWAWIRSGFGTPEGRELLEAFDEMNVWFLLVLGAGISGAVIVGGLVLPPLLENYPEVMRALFFGLIAASVWIPFRMVEQRSWKVAVAIGVGIGAGLWMGWTATAPDRVYHAGINWVSYEAEDDERLEQITRRGLSSWPGDQVFWADENHALRTALELAYPDRNFEAPSSDQEMVVDPEIAAERSSSYNELVVPKGTSVEIPQPVLWYIFLAGMIMVCAMILPGISGSYLLLILGVYFFMLNTLRTLLRGVPQFDVAPTAMLFVAVFMAGAIIGLLTFARVMSWMLERVRALTIGLLVGLMVGGLRGIWPFRQLDDGVVVNTLPEAMDATVMAVMVAALAGAVVVSGLTLLGSGYEDRSI